MIFWQNYTFLKKNKIACLTIRETILDNKNKLPEIAEKLLRSNLPPLIFRLFFIPNVFPPAVFHPRIYIGLHP